MSGWVLPVGVLFGAVERRRELLGLSLAEVAAAVCAPVEALAAMASGVVPEMHTSGLLLMWVGWQPDMARLVVGDAA